MTAIAIILRDVYGTTKAYPGNKQAKLLAELAGTKTLTQRTLATAMQMGFDVKVAETQYHAETGSYRSYTETDVRRIAA